MIALEDVKDALYFLDAERVTQAKNCLRSIIEEEVKAVRKEEEK